MWNFGRRIREVERSHHRVVFQETATYGAAWLFAAFSLAVGFFAFRNVAGLFAALLFGALALYASVSSTFSVDLGRGELGVQRRFAFWNLQKSYESETIDRVYVVSTRKGSGLAVRFKTGRQKNLTTSLGFDFASLDEAAGALNLYLHRHRTP